MRYCPAPPATFTPAERVAVAGAAHIDLDGRPARLIRKLLEDRFRDSGLVTDWTVAVTTAAYLESLNDDSN